MRYALSNHSSSFHASPKYSQYLVQIRHPHVIWFVSAGCKRKTKKTRGQRKRNNGKKVQHLLDFGLFLWKIDFGKRQNGWCSNRGQKTQEKGKKGTKKSDEVRFQERVKKPTKLIFPILSLPALHTHCICVARCTSLVSMSCSCFHSVNCTVMRTVPSCPK